MKSYEVLREAIKDTGVKQVASDLRVSTSLVYKWCQNSEGEDAAGADNPLDRILRVVQSTGNKTPVEWLAQAVDGYLVENPKVDQESLPVVSATRSLLNEFSELLLAVSESLEDDGKIDKKEASAIRKEWEDLKRRSERFVVACERGVYNNKDENKDDGTTGSKPAAPAKTRG